MDRTFKKGSNWTKLIAALVLMCSVFGFTALAQTNPDKPLDAKTLAALVEELKGVVSRTAPDASEAAMVGEKWNARKDLAGKTKKDVVNLLYQDVKSVIAEILFREDGTCENTYVSQYEDGKISDDDYTAPCEWSVNGSTVKIIENADEDAEIEESEDQVLWLKDVKITRTQIKSRFSLQGNYTAGIEKLVYDIDE